MTFDEYVKSNGIQWILEGEYFTQKELMEKAFLAGQTSAIPDGYVLVPVESAQEMPEENGSNVCTMLTADEYYSMLHKVFTYTAPSYKSMIAAAQKEMK